MKPLTIPQLTISAREIIKWNDQHYIAALNKNLNGLRVAKLKWK